jgi:F-type H+-transporting ATPase subunit b
MGAARSALALVRVAAVAVVAAVVGLAAAPAVRAQDPAFPGLRQQWEGDTREVPPGQPFEPIEEPLVPFEEGEPVEAAQPPVEDLPPPAEVDVGVAGEPREEPAEVPAHGTPQQELYHEAHVSAEDAAEEHGLREENVDAAEHGAHGEAHLSDVVASVDFWGAVVNFSALVALIFVFGRRPLGSFLLARRKTIEDGLAEAARLREAAETRYEEYSERLEKLDVEIARIRREMIAAGEAERDRIVSEAEAKAARMRRDAEFLIEQQTKQMRVDLTREAVDAAVSAAEAVLRESTSAADQERLARRYVESLASEAKEAKA